MVVSVVQWLVAQVERQTPAEGQHQQNQVTGGVTVHHENVVSEMILQQARTITHLSRQSLADAH